MRVAVLCVPAGDRSVLGKFALALVNAFEAAGHRAEFVDWDTGIMRLAAFDYIVLGSEPVGIGGKIPAKVAELLASAPGVAGKRSMAFLLKRGLFAERALSRLMSAMEAEGMRVNYAELMARPEDAVALGRQAPVERN